MAKNDPNHPEIARAAQDVEAPAHREPEGPHHYGRGGAANITGMSEEEKRAASEERRRSEEGKGGKGVVDKGRELLRKVGGKK